VSRRVARRLIQTALCGSAAWIALVLAALGWPALAGAQSPPQLEVSAAALYAPQTGQMLFGLEDQRELAIASTTKLMTALITLQHVHHLGTVFTQNDWYPAAEDSQLGLDPGDRMSVHDLLLAMMLPSADDAAEDLADNVGRGSVARFVAMMNAEAALLGLRHTHYSTPIGLDTPGNYSTASDLVRLAAYDLSHSAYFARIVALPGAVLHTGPVGYVANRNDLVGRVPWIDGVKTGHTGDAGYVLVASGERNGMKLISAVLGTSSEQARDANTLALLGYGFEDFSLRTVVRAGEVLARPRVNERPGARAQLVAASTYARVLPRDAPVRVEVRAARHVTGPLPARAVLGTATVIDGTRTIAQLPLVLARALPKVSGLTIAARFITRPLALACIGVLVALGVGARSVRVRSGRRRSSRISNAELDAT
jgi:D-alanyl-D-alanine carboxypeptidase (penicillin-binding protein 5/6)